MKVALFGGRFDPVHNGHLAVAREVLKMEVAQEVWFSIENQHQWRPIVGSVVDRKNMVELAIASASSTPLGQKMHVDMTPVELGGLTETITVMRRIKEKYPQHQFIFVCGSDQLPTFPKWSHWNELQKEVQFLIIARKGSPLVDVPQNATIIDDPTYEPLEDSATRIRELRKSGKSISGLVPEKVEKYIIKHNLYV